MNPSQLQTIITGYEVWIKMTLFQHHCLMLQIMCTLAEKLCFHVQSQKQKSMFRLIARLIWNHDIQRKRLFAYLHDKGVLDD